MITTVLDDLVIARTDELDQLTELARLIQGAPSDQFSVTGPNGETVALGEAGSRALRMAVEALAAERIARIESLEKALTVEQAAALINVPRSYLVERLEQGELPSHLDHGRPRVWFDDLMTFERHKAAVRREALRFLSQQGQEIAPLLEEPSERRVAMT